MVDNRSQYVTCHCVHCDNGIEFDASDFTEGETRAVECPHCKLETILAVSPPQPTTIIRRYPYNPGLGFSLGATAFFAIGFAITLFMALHNTVEVRARGFRLDPESGKVFYGIGAVGNGLILLMTLTLLVRQIAFPKEIVFESDAILFPHGILSRKTARIPYADIDKVMQKTIGKTTNLYITAYGQEFVIIPSLFANAENYVSARDFLIKLAAH